MRVAQEMVLGDAEAAGPNRLLDYGIHWVCELCNALHQIQGIYKAGHLRNNSRVKLLTFLNTEISVSMTGVGTMTTLDWGVEI